MKISSRLERIVPSLELCKLIPEGEFEDSVFVWLERPDGYFWDGADKDGNPTGGYVDNGMQFCVHEMNRCTRNIKKRQGARIYPAPTLRELLLAIADYSESICARLEYTPDGFTMECDDAEHSFYDDCSEKVEDAVLRQWLRLKGVEI